MSRAMSQSILVISPHPDDEIIGLFEVLSKHHCDVLTFGKSDGDARIKEFLESAKFMGFTPFVFYDLEQMRRALVVSSNGLVSPLVFTPDPSERHPLHRLCTSLVESIFSQRYVVYYTTDMTTDYVQVADHSDEKHKALDMMYPSQADMWKYEHKYWLFEGYRKKILAPEEVEVFL